jgi:hypothetical protein
MAIAPGSSASSICDASSGAAIGETGSLRTFSPPQAAKATTQIAARQSGLSLRATSVPDLTDVVRGSFPLVGGTPRDSFVAISLLHLDFRFGGRAGLRGRFDVSTVWLFSPCFV